MIIEQSESKYQLPEPGEHVAKLDSLEDLGEMENRFKPGEKVHRLQLIWELKDGSKQYQWVTHTLHTMSRLYEIAQALLGGEVPKRLDTDTLKGKSAIITLKRYKGEDGRERSKVADIRPLTYKGRAMPPPEREEFQADDNDVPF